MEAMAASLGYFCNFAAGPLTSPYHTPEDHSHTRLDYTAHPWSMKAYRERRLDPCTSKAILSIPHSTTRLATPNWYSCFDACRVCQ